MTEALCAASPQLNWQLQPSDNAGPAGREASRCLPRDVVRRRSTNPTAPKPSSSIDQVLGSGTADALTPARSAKGGAPEPVARKLSNSEVRVAVKLTDWRCQPAVPVTGSTVMVADWR